jgi:hypothetical protein
MKTSETLGKFAEAMAKVQAELKPAQKNATNPFLKNKYADLGAIIEACQELAGRNGLATVQMPFTVQGGMGITTRIIHTSGEWVEGEVTFELTEERGISNAQAAGKLLTYARRYALAAAFGVVADDDADGHVEAKQPAKQPAKQHHDPVVKKRPADWYTQAPADKVKFVEFILTNVFPLSDSSTAMTAIKETLNGANFADVDKAELAQAVAQWQPAPVADFDDDDAIAFEEAQ